MDMNTPETDANTWSDSSEGVLFKVVSVEFARRLERERDEAREKMADALQEVDLRTLDFERMKQERDEARNLARVYQHQYYTHVHPNAVVPYLIWERRPEPM